MVDLSDHLRLLHSVDTKDIDWTLPIDPAKLTYTAPGERFMYITVISRTIWFYIMAERVLIIYEISCKQFTQHFVNMIYHLLPWPFITLFLMPIRPDCATSTSHAHAAATTSHILSYIRST